MNNHLNIEGYLTYPEKYVNHKPYLDVLDGYFKNCSEKLKIPLSINERSFQIFQVEKALKEDKFLSIVLNFNMGVREALNYYNTAESFFTHNKTWNRQDINILILENKDTWYTLKSIISPNKNKLAGISFDILLYGEGKKIARKIDTLTEFDHSFLKSNTTNYYYFGDLDYEGIGIFNDFIKVNPLLNIRIMVPLYSIMLNASIGIQLPVTKEKQNKRELDEFISFFNIEEQAQILRILQSGKYIPQEILNRGDFLRMINFENVGEENV